MKARMKMMIVGIVLIVLGCTLFVGCSAANGFDWSKLSTEKYESKSYTVEQAFENITVEDDTSDVKLLSAADGVCKIEYGESKNIVYDISVDGDTLNIKKIDNRKWYHYIGFNFAAPDLTIYLPETAYKNATVLLDTGDVTVPDGLSFESLRIKVSTGNVSVSAAVAGDLNVGASTGDISVSNTSAASASLTTSTGRIEASGMTLSGNFYANSSTGNQTYNNVTCSAATMISSTGDKIISSLTASGNLVVESDTGDDTFANITCADAIVTTSTGHQSYTDFSCASVQLRASTGKINATNLIAAGQFRAETSTGDITLERCDATSLTIVTDTGDVKGSLLSPKIFYTQTDTGKIEVPRSTEGGLCEVTTDTGDIRFTIVQ
ncbi:MAG: DUF4097 family beta strand repeat protein [Clostridia bacterium]|nr:DUF4097 family beta strand repeat protein [Clostridia bacterium]